MKAMPKESAASRSAGLIPRTYEIAPIAVSPGSDASVSYVGRNEWIDTGVVGEKGLEPLRPLRGTGS